MLTIVLWLYQLRLLQFISRFMNREIYHKNQAFQVQIRRKQRAAIRNSMKKKAMDIQFISQALEEILLCPQYLHRALSSLSYILDQFDVEQIPVWLLPRFGKAVEQVAKIYDCCDYADLEREHWDFIHILCSISSHEHMLSFFTAAMIKLLVGQMRYFIAPRDIFFQCMISLGNILTGPVKDHIGMLVLEELEEIDIESIVYNMLAMRNCEKQEAIERKEFLQGRALFFKNEEVLIWFVSKYLRFLANEEAGLRHPKLPLELIHYLSLHFSIYHELLAIEQHGLEGEEKEDFLGIMDVGSQILKHAGKIIATTHLPISEDIIEQKILPIIQKKLSENCMAFLWRHLAAEINFKQDKENLLSQIIRQVDGDGENPKYSKRNCSYLMGIYSQLLFEESQARAVWMCICESPTFERLMLRQDIAYPMDKIVGLVGEVGEENCF